MSAAHDIRGTVEGLRQWQECNAEELLTSPWRHALGVWPLKDGISSFPLCWRWTFAHGPKDLPLYVTNDERLWHAASTIRDVELAHLLEAGELLQLNGALLDVLKRRGRGGYITWHMASGADDRSEADRCGRRFTLREALKALGLTLRKVEVRP
jgi:hypothetical protein